MKNEFDELMGVFIDEAAECADALDADLVELESNPVDSDRIAALMRVAHNLKGASGTVGQKAFADGMHSLESVFRALESGQLAGTAAVFQALFGMIDGLRAGLTALRQGADASLVLQEPASRLEELLQTGVAAESSDAGEPDDPLARFVLGEYDRVRIDVGLNRGRQLYVLTVSPTLDAPEDPDWISWNRQVQQTLRAFGDIIATDPPSVQLDRIAHTRQLAVLLVTERNTDSLTGEVKFARALLDRVEGPLDRVMETEMPPEVDELAAPEGPSLSATGVLGVAESVETGETIRVSLERIDSLVELLGELVVVESMVSAAPELASVQSPRLKAHLSQLTKITRDLQEVGMLMRMVSVRGLFKKMRRIVRDLASEGHKTIRLVTAGETSEIDRAMVEHLSDPLVHLIRNAVDHGIESVSARQALGKPDEGTIRLSAFHQGGKMVIRVGDDGAGLDRNAIAQRARAEGLIVDPAEMSDAEVYDLIFTPGFSTAANVTAVSGRGVGMDVVKRSIEALHGRVIVSSKQNRGTTFELVLPLTLAIIDGMLVRVGVERYIVPTLSILESIQPGASMLHTFFGDYRVMKLRDETIPLVFLGEIFGVDDARTDPCSGLVVVVEAANGKLGIVVDDVLVQQQIVIKNVGYGMGDTRFLSGAAILSDGQVGLIVNVDELAKMMRRGEPGSLDRAAGEWAANRPKDGITDAQGD